MVSLREAPVSIPPKISDVRPLELEFIINFGEERFPLHGALRMEGAPCVCVCSISQTHMERKRRKVCYDSNFAL